MRIIEHLGEMDIGGFYPEDKDCPIRVLGSYSRAKLAIKKDVLEAIDRGRANTPVPLLPSNTPNTRNGYYLLPEMAKVMAEVKRKFPAYEVHVVAPCGTGYGFMPSRNVSTGVTVIHRGNVVHDGKNNLAYAATETGPMATMCVFTHPQSEFVQAVLTCQLWSSSFDGAGLYTQENSGYKDHEPPITFWSPRISRDDSSDVHEVSSKHPSTIMRTASKALKYPITGEEQAGLFKVRTGKLIHNIVFEKTKEGINDADARIRRLISSSTVRDAIEKWAKEGTWRGDHNIATSVKDELDKQDALRASVMPPEGKLWWIVSTASDGTHSIAAYTVEQEGRNFKLSPVDGSDKYPVTEELREAVARVQMLEPYDFVPNVGFRDRWFCFVLGGSVEQNMESTDGTYTGS